MRKLIYTTLFSVKALLAVFMAFAQALDGQDTACAISLLGAVIFLALIPVKRSLA